MRRPSAPVITPGAHGGREAIRPSSERPAPATALSLIPAAGARGRMRFMILDKGSVNAGAFIEFLKRLVKNAARAIFLTVDRGAAHRAKKVSAFVPAPSGKLRLLFLPPYAPGHHPGARAWKHLKADAAARTAVAGKEGFTRMARRSMRDLQNDPRKIRAFFQKPSLKYAA